MMVARMLHTGFDGRVVELHGEELVFQRPVLLAGCPDVAKGIRDIDACAQGRVPAAPGALPVPAGNATLAAGKGRASLGVRSESCDLLQAITALHNTAMNWCGPNTPVPA